jgi:probable HAF family extracellular repeat protein
MNVKRIVWIAAAWAAIGGVHPGVARAEYGVIDLGAMNSPGGVNAAGQVALTSSLTGMPDHALRYSAGSFLDLGTLGGSNSVANGINAAGQVVGRSDTASGATHAFVWTQGGMGGVASNPQMLDLTPTADTSEANAINRSGQIVGYVTVANGNQPSTDAAFIYSGGTLTQLPLPGGYQSSYAYSINDSGKVAGAAYTGVSSSAHGFFYNGTSSVDIGDLGGANTSPAAINNNDRIVGYSTTAAAVDHAFLYVNGVMTDLGTLGGNYSYANAINNNNQIVGGSYTDALDSIYHAFISDGTRMTDLNSLVTSKASDWVLSEGDGINDNGVIVGMGDLSGQTHAFMLKPLLPGDANADGKVDFTDLLTLAQNYGKAGATWEQGDFNGDGTVNFSDLLALAQNYGGQINLAAASASIPEPGILLSIIAGALTIRRRSGSSATTSAFFTPAAGPRTTGKGSAAT